MSEPKLFKPHALTKAPIISESRVVTPITEVRNYTKYDLEPAWKRTPEFLAKMERDLAYWHEHGDVPPKEPVPVRLTG